MNVNDFKKNGFVLKNGSFVSKGKAKSSKFGNNKVEIDGLLFDSTKEGNYYSRLKLLKNSGEIIDFKRQVKYAITINNIHIANYFLDFEVTYTDGTVEYIDIKGLDKKSNKFITTDVFQLKKKLVQAIYGIKIKII